MPFIKKPAIISPCRKCKSTNTVFDGKKKGRQGRKCKDCGHRYLLDPLRRGRKLGSTPKPETSRKTNILASCVDCCEIKTIYAKGRCINCYQKNLRRIKATTGAKQ